MATLSKSAVVQAFLVDHRKFMKLLLDVALALESSELEKARQFGTELNGVAGPHIAFEEAVLYPSLDEKTHERSFVTKLYDEHQAIVDGLRTLLEMDELDAETAASTAQVFHEGLEHAEHCGTLISRLAALDESDQREALDELIQLRSSGIQWTDLKKEA